MNTLSTLLEGKKTFVGLFVITLGFFGFGEIIAEQEVALAVDNILQFAGICFAVYGRLVTKGK